MTIRGDRLLLYGADPTTGAPIAGALEPPRIPETHGASGAAPEVDELPGLFEREGFTP